MSIVYNFENAAHCLVQTGNEAFKNGWVPATSGNFSLRLGPDEIAITVSGRHKGHLTVDDIMRVDLNGKPLDNKSPSAETCLHISLYRRFKEVNSVLHTHSPNSTVLSKLITDSLLIQDLEILKAFNGINTHETCVTVPVFDNDQDIPRLSVNIESRINNSDNIAPGYLIKGHGLYTWGNSVSDAMRHLEAFEFIFDCELIMRRLTAS